MKRLFFLCIAIIMQEKVSAFESDVLFGKWYISTLSFIEDGAQMIMHPQKGGSLYFYDNGKGILSFPSHEKIDFLWTISTDTLNIVCNDTLSQYLIVEFQTNRNDKYINYNLELKKKGCNYFNMSFKIHKLSISWNDFIYNTSIEKKLLSNKIKKIIQKSKKRYSNVIIGHESSDKKIHYNFNTESHYALEEIIKTQKEDTDLIFIMYDYNMQKLRKILYLTLSYDSYQNKGIDICNLKLLYQK